ncbi:hypothetical protein [Cohnella hashimotonis]|uniref:Uncharacterized protein n=1 Tax=Cohnella hashimotonis TaxID=2826895 RepID=A0ABT6TK25_9BACL|nr:hypothetical protein [Cohnella hashimotonis]MDI4647197.1 hypothetical protein [Cohnella hashimotonis]
MAYPKLAQRGTPIVGSFDSRSDGLACRRSVVHSPQLPANIHLFLPMPLLWNRIDAKKQLFFFIGRVFGLPFAFTCIFAGIL